LGRLPKYRPGLVETLTSHIKKIPERTRTSRCQDVKLDPPSPQLDPLIRPLALNDREMANIEILVQDAFAAPIGN
jgi:hypothetical protein